MDPGSSSWISSYEIGFGGELITISRTAMSIGQITEVHRKEYVGPVHVLIASGAYPWMVAKLADQPHPFGVHPNAMTSLENSTACLTMLSGVLLRRADQNPARTKTPDIENDPAVGDALAHFDEGLWNELQTIANTHHVIMRSYPAIEQALAAAGEAQWAERIADAFKKEQARIGNALSFLEPVCAALGDAGTIVVIKSLDHWPDLGNDLDLYTDATPDDVIAIMSDRFGAKTVERSWGDRLASKWNFAVPGLPELIEIHIGRLGQTGEQRLVTNSLRARARLARFGSHVFRVPASEDRMIISTLQRMYRHFYIRLCDIADNARLMDAGAVDYAYLRALAEESGLWAGIATYLTVISDYVKQYRGEGISLPVFVRSSARFGGDQIYFRKNFLRVPIVPHSASLYAAELMTLLLNGEVANTLRLSLLPALATAAALELKLTGSDKGIW